MYKNTHFPTVRLKIEKIFKDFTKNILSCPGECGKSGKSLLWSLTVYDKKDLVKLHCWDPHRCPQVPVVPWAWSAHCPENSTHIPHPLAHLARTFHHPEKCSEREARAQGLDEGNRLYLKSTRSSNMSDCYGNGKSDPEAI